MTMKQLGGPQCKRPTRHTPQHLQRFSSYSCKTTRSCCKQQWLWDLQGPTPKVFDTCVCVRGVYVGLHCWNQSLRSKPLWRGLRKMRVRGSTVRTWQRPISTWYRCRYRKKIKPYICVFTVQDIVARAHTYIKYGAKKHEDTFLMIAHWPKTRTAGGWPLLLQKHVFHSQCADDMAM